MLPLRAHRSPPTLARLVALVLPLALAAACDSARAPAPKTTTSGQTGGLTPQPTHGTVDTPPVRPPTGVARPAAPELARLATSSNAFGFDLFRILRKTSGNLAFSPASIESALAMAWAGAKGDTASELQKTLHLEGEPGAVLATSGQLLAWLTAPERPLTLRVANRLFVEASASFEPSYLAAVRAVFGAEPQALDFKNKAASAHEPINAWVEAETDKHITGLLSAGSLSADTRMVLVNALYFLGKWQHAFDEKNTREAPFYAAGGEPKNVLTMSATGDYRYAEITGGKVLELSYVGGSASALFVLPDARDGLAALEASFDAAAFAALDRALGANEVRVALPKFKVAPSESLELAGPLRELGVVQAFERARADFSGIARPADPSERLSLGGVRHKAFVQVDEQGTKAAAATAVTAVAAAAASGAPPERAREFIADHPFLFFVRDQASGLVLFMGRVTDPQPST